MRRIKLYSSIYITIWSSTEELHLRIDEEYSEGLFDESGDYLNIAPEDIKELVKGFRDVADYMELECPTSK